MARKAALIIGAARGIGRKIAERLAAQGYHLALHCVETSRAEAKEVAARLAHGGIATFVVAADLIEPTAPARIVAAANEALGPLCLLVNTAAIFEEDDALAIDPARWDRIFAVNLRASLLLAQEFVRQVPQGHNAAIINVIDQRISRATPQFFSYSLSKSGLWRATRTMAQAFGPLQIRVNAVWSGPSPRAAANRARGVAEIAEAVLYLAEARSVTGQRIAIDMGQQLGGETPGVWVDKKPG